MKMTDIKRFLGCGVAAFAALATACVAEEVTPFTGSELGAVKKVYEVESVADELHVDVYANNTYTISLLNEADWIQFPSTSSGDKGFDVSYGENTGAHRQAILRLAVEKFNHADTVYVRQRGQFAQYLKMEDAGVVVSGSEAASSETVVDTNLSVDEIDVNTIVLAGDDEWIYNARVEETNGEVKLLFDYTANASETELRKARITLSFLNAWNQVESYEVAVTQRTATDALGNEMTFEQLRAMADVNGVVLQDDVIIEGIVVSNRESGNAGDNLQNSPSTIDYKVCERTVYVESLDGAYGLMMQTSATSENIFKFGDKVKFLLRGAKLFRSAPVLSKVLNETTPDYYWLTGVTSSMVISRVEGVEVPVKAKMINELTDADIFTYVQLQDCELSMRKGPMTPINEGYANATDAHRTAKYPILLHDKNGDAIYIYTNTTCLYRRDGKRLPYGSGTMSGVIVHELYSRFEYADNDTGDEDTYGNIGRYQIRHQSYEDFGMAQDSKDGFSTVVAEWCYITDQYLTTYPATAGTDKNAVMTHTFRYTDNKPSDARTHTCINFDDEFSYLGPVGNSDELIFGNNRGNVNGVGVILDDGTNWMAPGYTGYRNEQLTNINNNSGHQGKGQVPGATGSGWKVWYNLDAGGNEHAFLFTVSTKAVSATDKLYAVTSMQNTISSGQFGPRYWLAEYSTTDNTGRGDDAEWVTVKRFSVPDRIQWTPISQPYQSAGYKSVLIELPADVLAGKDEIYIRLRPDLKGGFGSTLDYVTEQNAASQYLPWTSMNYFAVRYNN